MKTVFSNAMCAHVWAQQSQPHGNSGSMYFDGETLYSYATPVARITKANDGRKVALITSNSYSITTSSKHMPVLHRALGYGRLMPGFSVPFLGITGGMHHIDGINMNEVHDGNLKYLCGKYHEAFKKGCKGREELSIERFQSLADAANNYAEYFGLDVRPFDPVANIEELNKVVRQRQALYNTPEALAKREKEKARRDARKAEKEAREARERFERKTIAREAWLAGEGHTYDYEYDEQGGVYLRVKNKELQTSQGATVPLSDAVRAFQFILQAKENGKASECDGYSIHVGQFEINSIDREGNIKAGCHYIRWPEIARIATQLGLLSN